MIRRRIYYFIVSIILSGTLSQAQVKNDYVWTLGYPPNIPEEYFGGTLFDFGGNNLNISYFNTLSFAREPGVLSSNSGKLIAYLDGCHIYNGEHEIMENGDSINYGSIWESYCGYGYPGTQNNLILPFPGDTNKAIVFYLNITDGFETHNLLYSVIEFNDQFPLGVVTQKDVLLLDPGLSSLVTATKHGNGRDWWLIIPEEMTNRFFVVLIDPYSITVKDTQTIGHPWDFQVWASQAVFSPDGTKYVRFNPWKGLDIINFNRCTGELYEIIESGPLSDPIKEAGGVAISADSRFLYVSNHIELFQFNLHSTDILGSKKLVGIYDGFQDPFRTNFYQMMLAPDEKIYIFSTSGNKSIHVIQHPELEGDLCELNQHVIHLPTYIAIGSVNIPYFRNGPLDGSECDTLAINNIPIADFRFEIDTNVAGLVYFNNCSYFNPEQFHWDFGNGMMSSLEDPEPVSFQLNGKYTICLTIGNEYGNDTKCREIEIIDSMTNTINVPRLELYHIYPNPTSDYFYIEHHDDFDNITISIYNLYGQLVLLDNKEKVNIEQLIDGVYIVYIQGGNQIIQISKLVIAK